MMEKNGLGTEATRAAIIEKLIERQYITRSKRILVSTEKGSFLIHTVEALPSPNVKAFIDLKETSKWEAFLEKDPENFYLSVKLSLSNPSRPFECMSLSSSRKNLSVYAHCALLRSGMLATCISALQNPAALSRFPKPFADTISRRKT